MNGGIEHVARARVIALGIDVELQLERMKKPGFQPVLFMLRDARDRAIQAMTKLVLVDSNDALTIRKLQLEIMLFDDMVSCCQQMVENGRIEDRALAEEDRAEIQELILGHENWARAEINSAKED